MVLQNYIILNTGVPARLHFASHQIQRRTITDPLTGTPTGRNVLIFDCDQLNGQPVMAQYSIMAEKHANQFSAYLADNKYRDYDFVITRNGEGFRTTFNLQVIPRT